MARKTPFYRVVQKVQENRLTEEELSEFFLLAPHSGRPFDPNPRLNPEAVDIAGMEHAARAMESSLVRDLNRRRHPAARTAAAVSAEIVAEGDSWFRLPDVIMPKTMIDFLRQSHRIDNVARWGDTLKQIIEEGEFWPYVYSGKLRVLLFSAGGNDVLGGGELYKLLNIFDPHHAKPTDADYYLNEHFYRNLDDVISTLSGLVRDITSIAPGLRIVSHGYAYAIPVENGPWLGVPMMRQGLDPVHRSQLCRAIVKAMIDRFNEQLAALAARFPGKFVHVDLRTHVKPNEWFDELHVRSPAAERLAKQVGKQLH